MHGLLLVIAIVYAQGQDMPAEFLAEAEGPWAKWLDEPTGTAWHGVSLKGVLDSQFGPAKIDVENADALNMSIKLDFPKCTRRETLWLLQQNYGVKFLWRQQARPKAFMELLETEHRTASVGGYSITTLTHVMRASRDQYDAFKSQGAITKQQQLADHLYFAVEVDRDIPFPNGSSAHITVVQRYKTRLTPAPP